ncbi:MAG: hypothetical protein WBG32_10940 [Nodosilinea sp.]
MQPLIGHQLALLPGVAPYLISNPAACAICTQQRTVKGLSGSCPVCEWRETALSPEQPEGGLYALEPGPPIIIVTERSPDYGQRPLSPEQAFSIGDEVKVLAVQAHQSKEWIGRQGTVHKLSRGRVWVKFKGEGGGRAVELPFPVECLEKLPNLRRSQQRRYSPKGRASGWLEERQGNKKRKTPSVSYYYGWLDKDTCRKRYVPVGKVYRVHEMIQQRKPTSEILAFLGVQQDAQGDD